MKFSCDNCHAQYMISDEKVGAAGVRVRCKKCQNVIHVRRIEVEEPPPEDSTVIMTAEKMAELSAGLSGGAALGPPKVTADEIGQAFDSMFSDSGDEPTAAMPSAAPSVGPPLDDPDRAATRVFTANDIQRMATELGGTAGAALSASDGNSTQAADESRAEGREAAAVEWFVAVRDEQVGPLSVEDVKARWEQGEIGPDTLVWRAGLADWKGLSSVDELARLVAPPPTHGAAVERSTVKGVAPPASRADDAVDFKPSAASALASLASMAHEEMAAADRKAAEAPPPEARRPSPERGPMDLFGDLPPPVAEPQAPARRFSESSASASADSFRDERPAARPSFARRPEPTRESWKVAAIAGGGVLALLFVIGIVVWAFVLRPSWAQDERLKAELAQELARKAQPPPAAPVPAVVPPPAAPAKVAQAPAAPAPVAAAAPAPASKRAEEEVGRKRHHRRDRDRSPEFASASGNAPAAPAPSRPAASSGDDFLGGTGDSSIDKEFARELDGSGDGAGGAHKGGSHHSVYIPPPPGQESLPDSLSQSDVMEVIVQHKGSFAKCVQDQKRRDPGASGTLVMHWRIKPDGHPADVRPNAGDFQGSPLASCLKSQIGKLRFGGYRGAAMPPIDFPFSF